MEIASSPPTALPVSPLLSRTNTLNAPTRNHQNASVSPTKPPKPSVPISIPRRRKSARPPPRSPIRAQASSPDLLFNFDFSVSPDPPRAGFAARWEEEMARLPLQQRGRMNMLLFQRERTDRRAGYGYARFGVSNGPPAAGGVGHGHGQGQDEKVGGELTLEVEGARPYGREPFLCTIPKLLLRNTAAAHARTKSTPNPAVRPGKLEREKGEREESEEERVRSFKSTIHVRNQSAAAALPTMMAKMVQLSAELRDDEDEDEDAEVVEDPRTPPLITAFNCALASSILTSQEPSTSVPLPSTVSISPSRSPSSLSAALRPPTPVSPVRTTAAQPPRVVPRPKTLSRGRTSLPCVLPAQAQIVRTPAAPIVSFKVAEADRGRAFAAHSPSPEGVLRERGRSPYPAWSSSSGSEGGARRGSSAGALSVRIGTVLGVGRNLYAGRNVSGLLSTEELERSLLASDDGSRDSSSQPAAAAASSPSPSGVKWDRGRERERAGGKGWMKDIWARRGRARVAHVEDDAPDAASTPGDRW